MLRATWPASSSRRTACSRSVWIIALPTQASALALEPVSVSSRAVRSARSHRPVSARAPATPASALGWECMGMLLAIASPRRRWPTRTSRAGSSTGRCSLRPSRRSRWTASRPTVARSGSGRSSARSCVVVISAIASPSPSVAASSRSCRPGSVARSTSRPRSPWPLSASSVQYGRSTVLRGVGRPAALAVAVRPPVEAPPVGPEVVAQGRVPAGALRPRISATASTASMSAATESSSHAPTPAPAPPPAGAPSVPASFTPARASRAIRPRSGRRYRRSPPRTQ